MMTLDTHSIMKYCVGSLFMKATHMSNRIITLEDLTSRDACSEQVEKFKVAYPDGFEVTEANLLEAKANDFDVWWTRCLLGGSALKVYEAGIASAREDFDDVHASALEVYDAATASALADYKAVSTPAWEAYYKAARVSTLEVCQAATASAWEAYEAVRASAWENHEAVRIKALAIALNS
jgi:hypothetical protein